MQLLTERLILRLLTEADIEAVHELHCLEETDRFNTLGIPENIEETRALCEKWILENNSTPRQKFVFVIELKDDPVQFMGLIGINVGREKYKNAEVWFKFHYNFWNKGYGTEALKKVIDFGFMDLKLHRIEAGCAVANIGSVKVMEKAGMLREAHTRQLLPLKSGWSDNYGYAILSTD
ncbi:MAG: GNAT family N-acetyltransferase [Bacteroidota bacterium]